jgi:hypothetical protein
VPYVPVKLRQMRLDSSFRSAIYQVAMMQYEVFSALPDASKQEIQRLTEKTNSFSGKGAEGAVAAPLAASC